jgi:hypothetical protein
LWGPVTHRSASEVLEGKHLRELWRVQAFLLGGCRCPYLPSPPVAWHMAKITLSRRL